LLVLCTELSPGHRVLQETCCESRTGLAKLDADVHTCGNTGHNMRTIANITDRASFRSSCPSKLSFSPAPTPSIQSPIPLLSPIFLAPRGYARAHVESMGHTPPRWVLARWSIAAGYPAPCTRNPVRVRVCDYTGGIGVHACMRACRSVRACGSCNYHVHHNHHHACRCSHTETAV